MKSILAFTVAILILHSTHSLRLHFAATTLYTDNLAQSNGNYYFGSMSVIFYYDSQFRFMSSHPNAVNCPPSTPYADYFNNNQSCFACAPIVSGMNVATAKILFDLQTRQCIPCATGATAICN